MRRILLGLFILLPVVSEAQVANPIAFEFSPSADHNVIVDGISKVDSYEVQIFSGAGTAGTPVVTANIGKPVPGTGNTIIRNLDTVVTSPLPGDQSYNLRVGAKGPGGVSFSTSVPFLLVGPPSAPTGVKVIQSLQP